jgi:WD40 repeat protein
VFLLLSYPLISKRGFHVQDAIRCIAFVPGTNQWVLSCSDDRSVRLWDAETGVWQLNLKGHTGCVRAVDISRKENLLATASKDHYVTFWKYDVL